MYIGANPFEVSPHAFEAVIEISNALSYVIFPKTTCSAPHEISLKVWVYVNGGGC